MELVVSRDSGIGFRGGVGNKQKVGDFGGDGAILCCDLVVGTGTCRRKKMAQRNRHTLLTSVTGV